jgi:hypothetical protein
MSQGFSKDSITWELKNLIKQMIDDGFITRHVGKTVEIEPIGAFCM